MSTAPLDFSDPEDLRRSLEGVGVLYNTYWIRFRRGQTTFDQTVRNSRVLFEAAAGAGIGRIVHFSVANPFAGFQACLPQGQGTVGGNSEGNGYPPRHHHANPGRRPRRPAAEQRVWALRQFATFSVFGRGAYPVQPVYAGNLKARTASVRKLLVILSCAVKKVKHWQPALANS